MPKPWREISAWRSRTPLERFLLHTEITIDPNACWLWIGGRKKAGYGHFSVGNKKVIAHRWSYQHFIGSIPENYEVDHAVCNNPSCVRPDHLEAVTVRVNRDRRNARKTHCPRNHPYNETNTRLQKDSAGYLTRVCRICEALRHRRTPRCL